MAPCTRRQQHNSREYQEIIFAIQMEQLQPKKHLLLLLYLLLLSILLRLQSIQITTKQSWLFHSSFYVPFSSII